MENKFNVGDVLTINTGSERIIVNIKRMIWIAKTQGWLFQICTTVPDVSNYYISLENLSAALSPPSCTVDLFQPRDLVF
jgi:hypothetical protein